MHKSKLVACIKASGKVLREDNETVRLPFGTEFSIYLKNLNTVRASVKIEIDGKDVLDGTSLVIDANNELNLERFIKNGNMQAGNRFKFVERNSKIEQTRGIKAEDGLVRIEFSFEKIQQDPLKAYKEMMDEWAKKKEYIPVPYPVYPKPWKYDWYGLDIYGNPYYKPDYPYYKSFVNYDSRGIGASGSLSCSGQILTWNASDQQIGGNTAAFTSILSANNAEGVYASCNTVQRAVNDVGITVAGEISNQKFNTIAAFSLEDEKHVIVLKLLGEHKGIQVTKPITTNINPKCSTCGTVNKKHHKCCRECGTSLILV